MRDRFNPALPVIVGHKPVPVRADRLKRNALDRTNAVYVRAPDGRACMRGHKFRRSDARKIVPKRRHDLRTPHGRIKRRAYEMDVTRAEMSAALGVAVKSFDGLIGFNGHRLKPWMLDRLAPVLALTADEVAEIHALGVTCLGWGPRDEAR